MDITPTECACMDMDFFRCDIVGKGNNIGKSKNEQMILILIIAGIVVTLLILGKALRTFDEMENRIYGE